VRITLKAYIVSNAENLTENFFCIYKNFVELLLNNVVIRAFSTSGKKARKMALLFNVNRVRQNLLQSIEVLLPHKSIAK